MTKDELATEIRKALADDELARKQLYRDGLIAGLLEAAEIAEGLCFLFSDNAECQAANGALRKAARGIRHRAALEAGEEGK